MPQSSTTRPGGWAAGLRRAVGRVLVGLVVASCLSLGFAAALLWTMPAQSIARFASLPPQVMSLEGSALAGRAQLSGGYVLNWRFGAGDLWRLRAVTDVSLGGPDTLLAVNLVATPGSVGIEDLEGRAGAGLLDLAPGLGLECEGRAAVDLDRLAVTFGAIEAAGGADISAGTCRASGTSVDLPASRIALSSDGPAAVALWTLETGAQLARLRVSPERRLQLRLEPRAAALAGLPSAGATELDIPF